MTDRSESQGWLADQRRVFEALGGHAVSSWYGVEMALRDNAVDGPHFSDPDALFLQSVRLEANLDVQGPRTIDTYQDDAYLGLRVTSAELDASQKWTGIYRQRVLDLPVGFVHAVNVHFEEGTLAEVTLLIEEQRLLLIAAEPSSVDLWSPATRLPTTSALGRSEIRA